MPWDRSAPTDPKYRTAEHRQRRAILVRQIRSGQPVHCTAKVCVFSRSLITNTDGRDDDGLNLGHEDNGIDYAGPQHRLCNVRDGAVRARARQDKPTRLVL